MMMAAMMACNALAIDVMLPALPEIVRSLPVAHANDRQYVVAAYMLATAFGALFYGPLADRYGRRPVVIGALTGYALAALACLFAPSFTVLVALRMVQGAAAAALPVVATSIVRDSYVGDRMARAMSSILMIFMLVPVVAPSLGQFILRFTDWHGLFLLLGIAGFALALWVSFRLPETLKPGQAVPIRPRIILRNWFDVLTHRQGAMYSIAGGAIVTGLMGFIVSAQQIVAVRFDAMDAFPYIFASIAVCSGIANFTNARIVERFGARRVSHGALLLILALSVVQWIISGPETPLWLFIGVMGMSIAAVALISSNFGSIAMEPFGAIAGSAASLQSSLRMAISAALGSVVGQQFDGTTAPLALGFLGSALVALLCVLMAEKGRLFKRRQRPLPHQA